MFHHQRMKRKKEKGQSLVELAMFFPVMLLLISGVIEFGFMLNTFLNLIDGPRAGARFAAEQDPFTDSTYSVDNASFYSSTSNEVLSAITPIELDSNRDDVVISVFRIIGNSITRYPLSGTLTDENPSDSTVGEWHLFGRGSNCSVGVDPDCHPSRFTNAKVLAWATQTNGGAIPPSMGVVLVEIFYNYHQTLDLPWLQFIGNPVLVYTYTMMPVPAAVQ